MSVRTISIIAAIGGALALACAPPALAGGVWNGTFTTVTTTHAVTPDGVVHDARTAFTVTIGAGADSAYRGEAYALDQLPVTLTFDSDEHAVGQGCDRVSTEHSSASARDAGNRIELAKAADGSFTLTVAASATGERVRHTHSVCDGGPPQDVDEPVAAPLAETLQVPSVDGSARHLTGSATTSERTATWQLQLTCAADPDDGDGDCERDATECPSAAATVASVSAAHPARLRGRPLRRRDVVAIGSLIVPKGGRLTLALHDASRLTLHHGAHVKLDCRRPPTLTLGQAEFASSRGTLATGQGTYTATAAGARARLDAGPRLTRVWQSRGTARLRAARGDSPLATLGLVPGDKGLLHAGEFPMQDTWHYAPEATQRPATASDRLPRFWDDGRGCSVGCRPAGAIDGWPIKPFHQQHPLRAGLNERRGDSMHIGIDIQAADGTPVYAIQGGTATVMDAGTVSERVQVGNYVYWHLHHRVHNGQYVTPYATVIGTIIRTAGHVHLSEVIGGTYLNPLRPGGRVLNPYTDTQAPIFGKIAVTRNASGYHVVVKAFDPQSFRAFVHYRTPPLAPAALAYRAFDAAGHDVTGLRWALRGSQHYAEGLTHVIYAHGAFFRGWSCFWQSIACPPDWRYRLTDGLTPPIALSTRRLRVYAYDWAGNVSAREVAL